MHHSPLLRHPESKPAPSTGTEQGTPGSRPQPHPEHPERPPQGPSRDLAHLGGGHALPALRWATRLAVPSCAPEKKAAVMSSRGPLPHRRASLGRGRLTRRARPCRHGLLGAVLPAHVTPGDACLPHRRPPAHVLLSDSVETGLRPLASPW